MLVAVSAGDDPGQVDGIEEGDGALAPPCPTEGMLQGIQQPGGVFFGIRLPGQKQTAEIPPDIASWNMVSGAAAHKARNGACFFQHEGVFRRKVRMLQQKRVKGFRRQRCIAAVDARGIPKGQHGGIVCG